MNHVRKTKRAGVRETICGAPVTDRDLTENEARRDLRWVTCPKCRKIMTERMGR